MNIRDLTIFTLSLFCIGLNWYNYKQFGRRSSLVLMTLMIACCTWDLLEVIF